MFAPLVAKTLFELPYWVAITWMIVWAVLGYIFAPYGMWKHNRAQIAAPVHTSTRNSRAEAMPFNSDVRSASGHLQTSAQTEGKSALPPGTDIERPLRHVRVVPTANSCVAAVRRYSITLSARARSSGGMVRPSAFAV